MKNFPKNSLLKTRKKPLNNNRKNDWSKANLKGRVKSYKELSYKAKNYLGKTTKGERDGKTLCFDDLRVSFNNEGNMIEKNIYNPDDSLLIRDTFIYDNNGTLIQMNTYHQDGSISSKSLYNYDDKNKELSISVYNPDGSLSHEWNCCKYNEDRNFTEVKTYKGDFKWKYKYDSQGNIIEGETYDSDDQLRTKSIYTYNRKGYIIKCVSYNSNGDLKGIDDYDNMGNKIEGIVYKSDRTIEGKQAYKYEYELHGNWVKRIEYENDVPKFIVERKYEYYD